MRPTILKTIDSATGEKISKCALTDDFKNEMDKALQAHNNKLNQFMIVSQQASELLSKWTNMRKEITNTDERFKAKMKYIAKKLKLASSDPWTYNLTEKCFEMREPPDIEPLTAGQVQSAINPEDINGIK